ncbi:hypothetical protein KY290_030958 [Solanum tuberosum]|uniref:Uncharacterized protein n=1 Tax=Solanum tuberosum TaxID=4113 RepID=A0ABQ7U7Y6_SOLTU|nr:hypothetical protein KY285_030044 [Solanum tuberosum]KAH0742965.1 hypothetical protein KY290_030958 [Solanum tuberosum]
MTKWPHLEVVIMDPIVSVAWDIEMQGQPVIRVGSKLKYVKDSMKIMQSKGYSNEGENMKQVRKQLMEIKNI